MGFLVALENSSFSAWIRESGSMWAYPGVLTLHTLGLAMLVGASFVVDLRLLGVAVGLPLTKLERFFGMMWAGFAINASSGVILFAADAVKKAGQPIFYIKLLLIAAALLSMGQIKKRLPGEVLRTDGVSDATRLIAVASLVLWACAITTGRLMAYLNNEPPPLL